MELYHMTFEIMYILGSDKKLTAILAILSEDEKKLDGVFKHFAGRIEQSQLILLNLPLNTL